MEPFGFDFVDLFAGVCPHSELLDETHALDNPLCGFDQRGAPIFKFPDGKLEMVYEHGLRMTILHNNRQKEVATATLHTPHTITLKKMAFDILERIRASPRVQWNVAGNSFYHVQLTNTKSIKRHRNRMELWTNARHCGRRVVLKTTTDPAYMLRYILEAAIQTLIYRRFPRDVARPALVGLTPDNRLVVCSEELVIPPVTDFIRGGPSCRNLILMSIHFCEMILRMQTVGFTHRDSHTSNVYVDPETLQTRLIDFDWSAIRMKNTVISVPRHLYDSTRESYGRNRSVDCCIFFRSLQTQMDDIRHPEVTKFRQRFLEPLMQRYEDECRFKLLGSDDTVSKQLYRIASSTGGLRGEYGHAYGLKRLFSDFDYEMGYFEWGSMRPEYILEFIANEY